MVSLCLTQCGAGMGAGLGSDFVRFLLKKCKSHPSYLIYYKKNFNKLGKQIEALKKVRNDIQRSVQAAEMNNEVIRDEVILWLNKVNKLETKFNKIENKLRENKRCFKGSIPNFFSRYKIGKEATRKEAKAKNLLDKGQTIQNVSQPPPPATIDSKPVGDFMAFGSTKDAMDKVTVALKDENVHLIGIYGMGGVGKTTLMEEIGRRVKKEEMFDAVVKVVVSQNPNLAQIQRDIADELGLRALGAGEYAARTLATRLKKEKKILIMLDDIWARLELREVGIPYGEEHRGCKIILTSRRYEVCHVMETNVSVEVQVLSEGDSWELFKSKAGEVVESPDIEPVAKKVAEECGGLPLAIVVVGRALRAYDERSFWDDALYQLKRSIPKNLEGVEEQLFKSLELSYKQLKTAELKVLFLYCCLFREDYDISEDELTRYAVGENLLSNVNTLEEVRGRVHFLLEKLKTSCLLLNSEKLGCVKLHDVVRDVAVYIASKDDNHFLVKAGLGMRDWPENENLEECKRISLMNNDIHAIPEQSNCSKLVLLLLNMNPISSGVQSKFFEKMVALNVLDLSDTDIDSLPASLKCLTNLGTLRLDRCRKLKDIAVVVQLKTLKILALRDCRITSLPNRIVNLVNLKLLDLSDCTSLKIPGNLISKLTRLEELYMIGYNVNEALLAEVASLKRLVRLELYVQDAGDFSDQHVVPGNAFEDLSHFIIYNRFDWYMLPCIYQKNFYLQGVSQSVNWAKPFLRRTEELRFENCQWNLTDLTQLDEQCSFECVKYLQIANCHQIQHLLKSTQDTPSNAFCDLERLVLGNMENLEQICQGQLPAHSLGKLRHMELIKCKKIVDIMPQDLLERVHSSLKELLVNECAGPQVLLNLEWLPQKSILFPNLRHVRIFKVSNLTSFCTGVVPPGSLQNLNTLEVASCDKLSCLFSQTLNSAHLRLLPLGTLTNLKKLQVSRCRGLKYVFLPSIARELQNLERMEIRDNGLMEAIVAEEDGVLLEKGVFPMLKHLLLINLPTMSSFYQGEPTAINLDLPSLEYIHLGGCLELRRLPIGLKSAPKLTRVHVIGLEDVEWFQSLAWENQSIPSRFEISQSEIKIN